MARWIKGRLTLTAVKGVGVGRVQNIPGGFAARGGGGGTNDARKSGVADGAAATQPGRIKTLVLNSQDRKKVLDAAQ